MNNKKIYNNNKAKNIIYLRTQNMFDKKKKKPKKISLKISCVNTPDKFDLSYFESIDDLNDQNSDFCLNI